jgi:hypothetical protein
MEQEEEDAVFAIQNIWQVFVNKFLQNKFLQNKFLQNKFLQNKLKFKIVKISKKIKWKLL